MPKVSEQGKSIRAAIKGGMAKRDYFDQDLADAVGISRMTFYRRMKSPDTFTIKELEKVAKTLCTTIPAILNGQVN